MMIKVDDRTVVRISNSYLPITPIELVRMFGVDLMKKPRVEVFIDPKRAFEHKEVVLKFIDMANTEPNPAIFDLDKFAKKFWNVYWEWAKKEALKS